MNKIGSQKAAHLLLIFNKMSSSLRYSAFDKKTSPKRKNRSARETLVSLQDYNTT